LEKRARRIRSMLESGKMILIWGLR